MRTFLLKILITAFGLWLADALLDGITVDDAGTLWLAGLLLGVVNAIVRPVVVVLTLPITFLSLGLFLFVINGAMVLLVARLLPAFHVDGIVPAIIASLIVGAAGLLAGGAAKKRKERPSRT